MTPTWDTLLKTLADNKIVYYFPDGRGIVMPEGLKPYVAGQGGPRIAPSSMNIASGRSDPARRIFSRRTASWARPARRPGGRNSCKCN